MPLIRKQISILFLSCFSLLLFGNFQCVKDHVIDYKYKFLERIDLFPNQKTYNVGDTIWIRFVTVDKTLFDRLSNQRIIADTVSPTFQISFNSRYDTPINPPGGFCDYLTTNGLNQGRYTSDYGTGLNLNFGCNPNNFNLLIGIIPKKTGIYSLDFPEDVRGVSNCPNRVVSYPISSIEYQYNLNDCNKDVYLSIPPQSRGESWRGHTENKIDNKQVFVFRVQ